ncbi:MAG: hypothetical protein HYX35_06385 [Proteobacteria bacterium]|nr:hypothetical protein [Pseudomonadota bacterium]
MKTTALTLALLLSAMSFVQAVGPAAPEKEVTIKSTDDITKVDVDIETQQEGAATKK